MIWILSVSFCFFSFSDLVVSRIFRFSFIRFGVLELFGFLGNLVERKGKKWKLEFEDLEVICSVRIH